MRFSASMASRLPRGKKNGSPKKIHRIPHPPDSATCPAAAESAAPCPSPRPSCARSDIAPPLSPASDRERWTHSSPNDSPPRPGGRSAFGESISVRRCRSCSRTTRFSFLQTLAARLYANSSPSFKQETPPTSRFTITSPISAWPTDEDPPPAPPSPLHVHPSCKMQNDEETDTTDPLVPRTPSSPPALRPKFTYSPMNKYSATDFYYSEHQHKMSTPP